MAKQPAPRVRDEPKEKAVPVEEPKNPSKYRTISDVINALQENSDNESVLRGIAKDFGAEYSSDFGALFGIVICEANKYFNHGH